ncbi:MAG: ATP:cob(I)alamin adenosyltransferase [Gammaproteobacteria bacterium RIFCSPHIGHO2_02_FULL_42_13]|nr:MAG: ATP:cob(I)alamin adenosyltransferase [Gammaproteobacteria bacterium RIFCSPHIGHO2_02_FULL_42_13]OGT68836.1 MAG: ATP:cob(I)alamin adenosyltransferase [Gammaproteobacteria bacterium RIFCSPLOWO2_02_FULL_42_9]
MEQKLNKQRPGDQGLTDLGDGLRVSKDHVQIAAFGAIDELNCAIGLLLTTDNLPDAMIPLLTRTQQELIQIGSDISKSTHTIHELHIQLLNKEIDNLNQQLPPLKKFILPGGTVAAAHAHCARAICRRAERKLVSLSQQKKINPYLLQYLNRLSDLLFLLARKLDTEKE